MWRKVDDTIGKNPLRKFSDVIIKELLTSVKQFALPVGLTIKNSKMEDGETVTGTGIGVKNIYTMMEQMKGRCEIDEFERSYSITLWFPIELSKKSADVLAAGLPIIENCRKTS